MILPFLFFAGSFLLLPIIGSVSVLLRISICFIFSIVFIPSFEEIGVLPSIQEAAAIFIFGIISSLPFLIIQLSWSNVAECIDTSRGVSLGGILHPFTEWVESCSSSVAGWMFSYFLLVDGHGFEHFIKSCSNLKNVSLLNLSDIVTYLWQMLPSLLSTYQKFFFTHGWIFGVFVLIELYLASLSRSIQQVPLHELSFLFKLFFLIFLGLGGYAI